MGDQAGQLRIASFFVYPSDAVKHTDAFIYSLRLRKHSVEIVEINLENR